MASSQWHMPHGISIKVLLCNTEFFCKRVKVCFKCPLYPRNFTWPFHYNSFCASSSWELSLSLPAYPLHYLPIFAGFFSPSHQKRCLFARSSRPSTNSLSQLFFFFSFPDINFSFLAISSTSSAQYLNSSRDLCFSISLA